MAKNYFLKNEYVSSISHADTYNNVNPIFFIKSL